MSNRNELLALIVAKALGTVRNPHNRNMLLEDWLVSVGGIVPGYPEQYTFDGIDDYITVADGTPVELLAGDVVEFDIVTGVVAGDHPILSNKTGWSSGLYHRADGILRASYNSGNSSVDGGSPSGAAPLPFDGAMHHIKYTQLIDNWGLSLIGASELGTSYYNNTIKNVKVTRLNPTLTHPNLYWPVDDGWAANPMIRQVIPHGQPYDGTNTFDSDGQVWLDYSTEAAPQYAGVVGYEQLVERSALSMLSELEESKRSAAEGLVKNGDFRFGDNGDWTLAGSGSGTATINTDGFTFNGDSTSTSSFAQALNGNYIGNVEYIIKFTASDIVNFFRVAIGAQFFDVVTVIGENTVSIMPDSDLARVDFNLREIGKNVTITNVSIRKATSQQVLTPTVNDGLANNFQPEGWSNYVPPEPEAFVTSDGEDFYISNGEQFLVQGEE